MDFAKRNIGKTNRNDATDRKSHGGGGGVTVIQQGGGGISLAEAKKEFLSKKADDNAEGVINFRRGLKILGKLINNFLTSTSDGQATDEAIMSAKRVKEEIDSLVLQIEGKYIRKDIADSTKHMLTLLKGAVFGKEGFAGGMTGHGARIDESGNGEMESLILRKFLQVPELHFNRVEVLVGDKWRAPGGGIFESVKAIDDMHGVGILRLEKGEYGAIKVGDICMGIFHAEDSTMNATADKDDYKGNFEFAGFYTCYFTITEITGADNKTFRYQLRKPDAGWAHTYHPSAAMTFVCYGSFNDEKRQSSVYETRTYRRFLIGQNDWEIKRNNIAMQDGDLSNLSIFGINCEGYSSYLKNVYFSGQINQFKDNGEPILTANDRGEWKEGTHAGYYDRFSHKGGIWLCIDKEGTYLPPSEDNPGSWICQVKGGDSLHSFSRWHAAKTPYPANAMLNMGGRVVISTRETSEPPYPLMTDKGGNYLTQNDGSYLIASYDINPSWSLVINESNLKDGQDGASLEVRYSSDKVSWHEIFADGDKWMQQRVGDGMWSSAIQIVGEDGKKGDDGPYATFEFAVNDSLTDAPFGDVWKDAPPAVGVGQYLWMRTGVVTPPATVPEHWNVARIKGDEGDKGDGYTQEGQWTSGKLVPKMGVVTMGGSSFVAKVATHNPPMWTLITRYGSRLTDRDGNYLLTGEVNTAEYDVWAEKGQNGEAGRDGLDGIPGRPGDDGVTYYTWLRYADDAHGNGISNDPAGKEYIGLAYNKKSPAESNNPADYTWSKIKGEPGVKGDFGYTWIAYSDNADGNPMYQQPTASTQYIGIAVNKDTAKESDNPADYTWSKFKGDDGEGFTQEGAWHCGKLVPKMGVVSMGGSSFVAKVATHNPPMWTLTDRLGNRITQNDGSYILSGGINTAEYELWAEKGDKGEDGKDGAPGQPGGNGTDGIDGCVARKAEWAPNIEWHNDSGIKDSNVTRYLDFCLVKNNETESGWDAYKCRKTHVSSSSIDYTNSEYWEKASVNVALILASFILAKNAKIDFLSGNEMRLLDEYQRVRGGISGSQLGEKIRFWAGAEKPEDAPYQVNQEGVTTASKFRTGKAGVRVEIMGGVTSVFGSFAKNIEFGVNSEGMAVMKYFDNDGHMLYDLGPEGIRNTARDNDRWVKRRMIHVSANLDGVFSGMNWEYVKYPYYSRGYDRHQFLSGYVGNAKNDPVNDRKYYSDATKDSLSIPDGYYVDCKGSRYDYINDDAERMMWLADTEPDDICLQNPYVNYARTVYIENVMHVVGGFITESFNVYFNLR